MNACGIRSDHHGTDAAARDRVSTSTVTPDAKAKLDLLLDLELGADGKLWFVSKGNDRIGRITASGQIKTFHIHARGVDDVVPPASIAEALDGAVWYTDEYNGSLHRVDLDTGSIETFDTPSCLATDARQGPDGAMWFACHFVDTYEMGVGRIDPAGKFELFRSDQQACGSAGYSDAPLAFDASGNAWFGCTDAVAEYLPQTGKTIVYPNRHIDWVEDITLGADGNMWFTSWFNNRIGRVTADGKVTTFTNRGIDFPEGITSGSDGNIWFTNNSNDRIGRITPRGKITTFDGASSGVKGSRAITTGPDGSVWFTTYFNDRIGRITPRCKITTYPR